MMILIYLIILSMIGGDDYNVIFPNSDYNNKLKINNARDSLQFMFKGFKVGNKNAMFQLEQNLATFAHRTYTVKASLITP